MAWYRSSNHSSYKKQSSTRPRIKYRQAHYWLPISECNLSKKKKQVSITWNVQISSQLPTDQESYHVTPPTQTWPTRPEMLLRRESLRLQQLYLPPRSRSKADTISATPTSTRIWFRSFLAATSCLCFYRCRSWARGRKRRPSTSIDSITVPESDLNLSIPHFGISAFSSNHHRDDVFPQRRDQGDLDAPVLFRTQHARVPHRSTQRGGRGTVHRWSLCDLCHGHGWYWRRAGDAWNRTGRIHHQISCDHLEAVPWRDGMRLGSEVVAFGNSCWLSLGRCHCYLR